MSELYERLKIGPVVYFLKNSEGAVKIGTSQHIGKRMKGYRDHCLDVPTVLAVEAGGRVREQELQKQFTHLNIKGEWFRLEGTLLLYIASLWANQTFEHGDIVPLPQLLHDTRRRLKRRYLNGTRR